VGKPKKMARLLAFYVALSESLQRFRNLIRFLGVIALIVFLTAIFVTKGAESKYYTLGSMIVVVWMIALNSLVSGFSYPMQVITKNDRLISRIKARISNGFRWCLVAFMTTVFAVTIIFTFRALGILILS